MIQSLTIRNYRSVREVSIDVGPMNAFIGRNNAGKSNLMRALNLVVGETYPSYRSFDEKDFYNYDTSNEIVIEVRFNTPLTCSPRVQGFRLTFDGTNCDYLAINVAGNVILYGASRELRVSNDMREEVALMYVGLERQASQQVRATPWTLYGKLLRHIERTISGANKDQFRASLNDAYSSCLQPSLATMEGILKTHIKRQTGLDLELRLSLIDPIQTLRSIKPYLRSTSGLEFDAEDMGAGTQSALAVAIARAYAEIVSRPLTLAIEEPELYLHPHGCRHFRSLLEELSASGIQVMYTTHERSFVDLTHFQNIYIVKKPGDETVVHSLSDEPTPAGGNFSVISKFDDEVNEVFFADKVVLVEASPDRIACQLALEKLGMDIDRESISITECGGSGDIKAIAGVLKRFGIPVYALIDEDPGNERTAAVIADLRTLLGDDCVFLQSPKLEGMLSLAKKPTKAEAMSTFPGWFQSHDVPEVYSRMKAVLES
jgi:putative ATP-dependent endonuclease of the OLD family